MITEKQVKEKCVKAGKNHLDIINKISVYDKENRKPSEEELQELYGYLDNCWICGKRFTFWDSITLNKQHCFAGNLHRRNCNI
jgi:hypothetical protein